MTVVWLDTEQKILKNLFCFCPDCVREITLLQL